MFEHRDMVSNFDHEDKPTYTEVTRAEYVKERLKTLELYCTGRMDIPTLLKSFNNLEHTLLNWLADDRREARLARGEKK